MPNGAVTAPAGSVTVPVAVVIMPVANVAVGAAATQQQGLPLQSQLGDPGSWPETWSVQLFRSIDSSSAAGLPTDQDTLKAGLSTRGSSRVVEFGIQVP